MECEFCKKTFTNKSALNKHKKQAKYCLDIQNVKPDTIHKCNVCEKTFNVKTSFERHKKLCKINPSKLIDEIEELKKTILVQKEQTLKIQLDHKDEILKNALDQVKMYQEQNEKLLMKAVSAPKVKNTTYNTLNIANFTAMTDEHIENSAKFLTMDHIKNGPTGYATFIVTFPCKDSIVVADRSRKSFKYKDENNQLCVDVEARNLIKKISKAIDPINRELILKAGEDLDANKDMDIVYKLNMKSKFLEYCNGIKFMGGMPTDFSRKLVHELMLLAPKRVNGMIEDKEQEKQEEQGVENIIEILSDAESEVIYYSDSG